MTSANLPSAERVWIALHKELRNLHNSDNLYKKHLINIINKYGINSVSNHTWTYCVLKAFIAAAGHFNIPGRFCYPESFDLFARNNNHYCKKSKFINGQESLKEYIVDGCWVRWDPDVTDYSPDMGAGIFVALECEWGGAHVNWCEAEYNEVLYDFGKLVDIKADVKVMVFGLRKDKGEYTSKVLLKNMMSMVEASRLHCTCPEQYLVVSLPTEATSLLDGIKADAWIPTGNGIVSCSLMHHLK